MFEKLFYLALVLGLLPILMLVWGKTISKETAYVKPLVWLIFVSGIYEYICTMLLRWETTLWFKLYGLLEFTCVLLLFNSIFNGRYKKFIYISASIYIGMFALFFTSTFRSEHLQTDSYLMLIATIFVYSTPT